MLRWTILILTLGLLGACMKPSDMQTSARHYLGDAGLMNHYEITRSATWTLQPDSALFISQGHFLPVGHSYSRPNVVAEETFAAAVQVFPRVRRAEQPQGLEQALAEARRHGSDYLLYGRFARARDAVGDLEHWNESQQFADLGLDKAVLQLMLLETATERLIDFAVIEARGGFLQFYQAEPEDLLRRPLEDYTRRLLGR